MNTYVSWVCKLGIGIALIGGGLGSGIAWGAEQTLYQQVLDTIAQLTPQDQIQLDIAVEPHRYAEKFRLNTL